MKSKEIQQFILDQVGHTNGISEQYDHQEGVEHIIVEDSVRCVFHLLQRMLRQVNPLEDIHEAQVAHSYPAEDLNPKEQLELVRLEFLNSWLLSALWHNEIKERQEELMSPVDANAEDRALALANHYIKEVQGSFDERNFEEMGIPSGVSKESLVDIINGFIKTHGCIQNETDISMIQNSTLPLEDIIDEEGEEYRFLVSYDELCDISRDSGLSEHQITQMQHIWIRSHLYDKLCWEIAQQEVYLTEIEEKINNGYIENTPQNHYHALLKVNRELLRELCLTCISKNSDPNYSENFRYPHELLEGQQE